MEGGHEESIQQAPQLHNETRQSAGLNLSSNLNTVRQQRSRQLEEEIRSGELAGVDWVSLLNMTGPREQQLEPDGPPTEAEYRQVNIKGQRIGKANTGTWKAAGLICAVNFGDFLATFSVMVNLVTYLTSTMHLSISKASTILNNFTGTCYLLAVLGGFIGDSYLGSFKTIVLGNVAMLLGLGLLTFTTSFSGLQPEACMSDPITECTASGIKYMAPLYLALYTIAIGTGFVKPTCVSLGADQFDETSRVERKQSVHFFVWFYFCINVALLLALTLEVYLQDNVSRSWGYGGALIVYTVCITAMHLGACKLRLEIPRGSFLTRAAQVLIAAFRKRNSPVSEDTNEHYNIALRGSGMLMHTHQLRFLNKAAVVDRRLHGCGLNASPWKLCSVSQVEETKRLLQLIPVWVCTWFVPVVFSQFLTFTIPQGQTLDRSLGPHFQIPPAALPCLLVLSAMISIPIYDRYLIPLARRFTKHPYGIKVLQRFGVSIFLAGLTMVVAALVERRRLTYVRSLHFEELPLGSYALPMKFWWLAPQFFLGAQVEFFLYVTSYQFFYHEAAQGTRSIGSSFTYSATAMGYFFNSVLVNIVNKVTRNYHDGSWLEENINNGGLEKMYWLMAVILLVNFLVYLPIARWYRCKYDWYHLESSQMEEVPQWPTSHPGPQDRNGSL